MAERSDLCEEGRKKVKQVMSEFNNGELRSSGGTRVTSEVQATAIAMSEGRRVCEEN